MNSRTMSLLAIAGFILLGAGCMGLRYHVRQDAQIARENTDWDLTYTTQFTAQTGPGREEARVELAMPRDTPFCEVLNADNVNLIIPNPKLRSGDPQGPFSRTGNQVLPLTTRQSGEFDASAMFRLRLSQRPNASRQPPLVTLSPGARNWYLEDVPRVIPVNSERVGQKLQLILGDATTAAEKLDRIFRFCQQIDDKSESASDNVDAALTDGVGTPLARARVMVTLSRAARIPARLVAGFRIAQGTNVKPHVWAEAFVEQAWIPYDPTDGWDLTLPPTYLPVRRSGGPQESLADDQIVDYSNVVGQPKTVFSIRARDRDASLLQGEVRRPSQILNLRRLPVPMHTVMTILLLLPFAALITTIMRNVVGIGTFGTFSPALLAMSFIFADLTTGLAILAIVVGVGVVGRTFLEKLRLLMVPRLSIILTMVILCVVFGISILHYMLNRPNLEFVLLPMVIMTMLIERFYVSAEEDGLMFTIQLAAGTLLVAVLCYLVLLNARIGEFALTYPEVHFFTIAAFIFLGRYAGYRLTELWRFSDLVDTGKGG